MLFLVHKFAYDQSKSGQESSQYSLTALRKQNYLSCQLKKRKSLLKEVDQRHKTQFMIDEYLNYVISEIEEEEEQARHPLCMSVAVSFYKIPD